MRDIPMMNDGPSGEPFLQEQIATLTSTNAELRAEVERLSGELDAAQKRIDTIERDPVGLQWKRRAEAAERAAVKVKPLEWKPTKTLNRNDYHGSKPYVVECISAGEFRYTLSANYQVGASWDARRGTTIPIKGGTCVSFDDAKAAAQADYERRILSTLSPAESEPEQEAVAWLFQYEDPEHGSFIFFDTSPNPAQKFTSRVPLYTRPPSEQAVTEARGRAVLFTYSYLTERDGTLEAGEACADERMESAREIVAGVAAAMEAASDLKGYRLIENHSAPNDAGVYVASFKLVRTVGPEHDLEGARAALTAAMEAKR